MYRCRLPYWSSWPGLQADRGAAYLFISHDLAVVRAIADRVAVLYQGRICELGPVADIYAPPYHPYTETLLAAVPEPVPGARAQLLAKDVQESEPPAQRVLLPATLSHAASGPFATTRRPPANSRLMGTSFAATFRLMSCVSRRWISLAQPRLQRMGLWLTVSKRAHHCRDTEGEYARH